MDQFQDCLSLPEWANAYDSAEKARNHALEASRFALFVIEKFANTTSTVTVSYAIEKANDCANKYKIYSEQVKHDAD